MLRTAHSLRDAAQLYRHWSVQERSGRDISSEHQALLNVVLAHDAYAAAELVVEHLRGTTDILLKQQVDGSPTTESADAGAVPTASKN